MDYAELCVTTNFTFLTGASHPEEMVIRAAELDIAAIAITDRNSLAGVVRAFRALKEIRRKIEKQAEEQVDPAFNPISIPSSRQPAGDARVHSPAARSAACRA